MYPLIVCLVMILLVFSVSVSAIEDEMIAGLKQDIENARELTNLLIEVQQLLLQQLDNMETELELVQEMVDAGNIETETVAIAKKRLVNLSSPQVVVGKIDELDSGFWRTDSSGAPTFIYFPEISFAGPMVMEADLVFLGGYRSIRFGLYDQDVQAFVSGGVDSQRNSWVVGSGTGTNPDRDWYSYQSGSHSTIQASEGFRLRVEITGTNGEVQIAVFVDGDLVHKETGVSIIDSGYPAVYSWASHIVVENLSVEDL